MCDRKCLCLSGLDKTTDLGDAQFQAYALSGVLKFYTVQEAETLDVRLKQVIQMMTKRPGDQRLVQRPSSGMPLERCVHSVGCQKVAQGLL